MSERCSYPWTHGPHPWTERTYGQPWRDHQCPGHTSPHEDGVIILRRKISEGRQ